MNKFLIGLATAIHLAPHPFGVSSVGATALYAGAYGPKRISWAVPLVPLFIGSLVFGFYEVMMMAFVFGGFALSSFAGRWFLARKRNLMRYGAAVAAGASIFFIVSNFGMWLAGYYPPTLAGLVQCYVNGLPFLGQAALADAAYCFVLFGLHSLIESRQSSPVIA